MHQGAKGVPIGGFLSARIAELWAMWRGSFFIFGEYKGQTCPLVEEELLPQWEETQLPGKPPTSGLSGKTDFTWSPLEAASKIFLGGMVRSPEIKNLTRNQLRQEGYDKFWASVERLVGCVEWGIDEKLFLLHTTAWGGATEGRLATVLNNTNHLNKTLVRNFFARPNPLEPLVAECSAYTKQREVPPRLMSDKHRLALVDYSGILVEEAEVFKQRN